MRVYTALNAPPSGPARVDRPVVGGGLAACDPDRTGLIRSSANTSSSQALAPFRCPGYRDSLASSRKHRCAAPSTWLAPGGSPAKLIRRAVARSSLLSEWIGEPADLPPCSSLTVNTARAPAVSAPARVRDVLSDRKLTPQLSQFTDRVVTVATGRPVAVARWRSPCFHPLTPREQLAFDRAEGQTERSGNYGQIIAPANATARAFQSLPPDSQLGRPSAYEVQADDLDFQVHLSSLHSIVVNIDALDGPFVPELLVRQTPPDLALLRGERAAGTGIPADGVLPTFAIARNVVVTYERLQTNGLVTERQRLAPKQAAAALVRGQSTVIPRVACLTSARPGRSEHSATHADRHDRDREHQPSGSRNAGNPVAALHRRRAATCT